MGRRLTGLGGVATVGGYMPPEWAAELEGVWLWAVCHISCSGIHALTCGTDTQAA